MFRSHSVLRRYTPPTCTLAVMAKNSPLSRWANQPVLKDLQFQLDLDDPKLPDEQRITVRGDRDQLESLCDAVTSYIQDFLATSHDRLSGLRVAAADASPDPLAAPASPATMIEPPASAFATPANAAGISLQPKGLIRHDLGLGSLATDLSGPVVQLSTLQLFDLANALDDYSTDVLDLPNLTRANQRGQGFNWAQVAAVLLLAVGLSTSAVKLLDGSSKSPLTATSSQGASSSDQKIASQLSPSVVEKATPAVISAERLPPPPTPGPGLATKPGLPTVATPKTPPASMSPGKLPEGAIATYPVPAPGKPTIIGGEVEPSAKANAKSQPSTSGAIAAAPPDIALAPSESLSTAARSRAAAQAQPSAKDTANASKAAGSTAFDTISQIAEVREYFQQRWKPPEGLTQTLEYSLQINPDGTIQSITPLKQVSGDYIDRTGMPLLGDPFVSPLANGKSAKIRLVLDPNGKVQAFNETP